MSAVKAQSVEALRKKLAAGKALTKGELDQVEEHLYETIPMAVKPDAKAPEPGEPADVRCKTQRALAEATGLHVNTITNWKNQGIAPLGDAPYSLKAYFLLLRRRGRLGECKPLTKNAHELWRWSFGAGAGDSINPDDPVHPAPVGWSEEKERQAALQTLETRRKARIEVETLDEQRIPADLVTKRLRDLVDDVKSVLGGFLAVPGKVKDLTVDQRADLSEAIQAQIAEAQGALARMRNRQ